MSYLITSRKKGIIDIMKDGQRIARYYPSNNRMTYYNALDNELLYPEVMEFIKEKMRKENEPS